MLNKIILEGKVSWFSWGNISDDKCFYINIQQERVFNKFKSINSFNAYANQPLAKQLANIVENNPNCVIIIEGKLRQYFSKKDNLFHTTILINKLINWSKQEKINNIPTQNTKT